MEYRPDWLNMVANALSHREGDDLGLAVLLLPSFKLFDELRQETTSSANLQARRDAIAAGDHGVTWRVHDGLILHDGRVFIPSTSALLLDVLQLTHTVGHEGV